MATRLNSFKNRSRLFADLFMRWSVFILVLGCAGLAYAQGLRNAVAGDGVAGYGGDSGSAIAAQLNGPYGVAVDGAGNLYIADGLCCISRPEVELPQTPDAVMPLPPFRACLIQ